jgi:glycosyltransferase involved in cell wall biosynthesis
MTLISVITPTWRRHGLLLARCMPSVYSQTHPKVEHVIVSDGPDRDLAELVAGELWRRRLDTRPVVYLQLPDHGDGPVDYGSRARNHGLRYAAGDLIAYLDDDNEYRPEHLELLAAALQSSGADFGYSRMLRHPNNDVIGHPTPVYGGIDTSILMHRRGVPEEFGWWPLPTEIEGDKHAPDWGVVSRWLDKGATWVHVPDVTVDYHFPT